MSDKMGVYRIICANSDRCYVGSSLRVNKRWRMHVRHLTSGRHHSPHLQAAWNKYGAQAFSMEIIEIVAVREELVIREQFWIDHFEAYKRGYNGRPNAANQLGLPVSEAARIKISAALKGRKISPEVRANMAAGLRAAAPFSEERRKNISTSLTGRKRSDQERANISQGHKGLKHSAETKAKMAASQKIRRAREGAYLSVPPIINE